jgi:hypothetical protein
MSLCAIVPAASMAAANTTLQSAGFGPRNFSVPAFGASGLATHGALHAWNDAAFSAAVKAIAGVVWTDAVGDPVTRTKALIEAQGAQWGAQAPPYAGTLVAGKLYRYTDGSLWSCIQSYSTVTYPAHPSTYPALIKRARQPGAFEPWVQPQGAHDSYRLLDPFTGMPEVCSHNSKKWRTKVDNNVWEPASGQLWDEIDAEGNVIVPVAPPVEEWPAWKPWTGINADLYQVGAKVSHAGKRWVGNTPNNHWEPGTYGWTQQP